MHSTTQKENNAAGNAAPAAVSSIRIQPKLSIGAVNDPLEYEADAMADKVMSMQELPSVANVNQEVVQRKCAGCEEEETLQRKPLASFIQRKESAAGVTASDAVSNQINASKGSGSNMDNSTQSFMQNRFGTDFSDVKIHTGGQAIQMNRELNAKAFTVGRDIYFNEGQYNPDSSEGKHLLAHELTHTVQQQSNAIQQKTIRRKKVGTGFGEFETTKFADAGGRGVEIILKFHPDKTKVDAKKIALSQSIRATLAGGSAYAIDPTIDKRMVGSGKSGAGYRIDQLSDVNNPIYSQGANLAAGKDLPDTPSSAGTPANVGVNTNYELGQCYKVRPTDADKTAMPEASLWDEPQGGGKKGESKMFETTALAIDGADKGKYYGSVKWGFKMEGTDAAPTLTPIDIESASMGTPTANFMEPAKLWNTGKTRGTLKVIADPEATVLNSASSNTEKIAKDKKLKQLDTVMWGADPAIKAEVLKADGTGSGKIVYIKNADVVDTGDGSANKQLPIVNVKVAKKQIPEVPNPPSKIFTPLQQPISSPVTRVIPPNTRVAIVFPGASSASGEQLPRIKILEGALTDKIISISLDDLLKLQDE